MKKTRMLSTTAAAAIVVVGFVPATSGNLAANFMWFGMGDSPVQVGDGSIHGYVRGFNVNYWRQKKPQTSEGVVSTYTAKANNPDNITLEGFVDDSGAAAPSPLTGTGGWLILISNADPDRGRFNRNSIWFCSTANTSPPFCQLGTPGTDKWIYLEIRQNGKWEEQPLYLFKRLYFLDTRPGCDSACNHISEITIQTENGPSNTNPGLPGRDRHTYKCKEVDHCWITVGQ